MKTIIAVILGLFALVGTAASHPGHGPELGYGDVVLHPFLGLDHAVVMALAAVLVVVIGRGLFVNARSGHDQEV